MTYPSPVKYLLIGKETTWGTGVTTDKDCGLIITDITTPHEREVIETIGVQNIEVQAINSGLEGGGLTLTGHIQHGRLFEYIIGSVAHNQTGSDWEHTFTISDNPPSMSAEVGNDLSTDTVQDIVGNLVESAELSIELNGVLTLNCNFLAKAPPSTSASASSSITSALPVFPHQLVTVNVNGSPASEVQNASISINKVVERSGGVGSVTYQQGHATEIRFEYSATLGFQDKTYHDLFVNDTTHEFEIVADNGTSLGSGKRGVQLVLENCKQRTFNEPTSVGGLTFVEIAGTGTLKTAITTDNIANTSW